MEQLEAAEASIEGEAPLACSICRIEIPLSAALTPEGEQYVEYYCGLECYETWFHKRCADEYPAATDYEWPAPRSWR